MLEKFEKEKMLLKTIEENNKKVIEEKKIIDLAKCNSFKERRAAITAAYQIKVHNHARERKNRDFKAKKAREKLKVEESEQRTLKALKKYIRIIKILELNLFCNINCYISL